MTISKSSANGTTTVTISWSATNAVASSKLDNAARWFFEQRTNESYPGRTYDSLTNSEKLDVIEKYLLKTVREASAAYAADAAQTSARAAALATENSEVFA